MAAVLPSSLATRPALQRQLRTSRRRPLKVPVIPLTAWTDVHQSSRGQSVSAGSHAGHRETSACVDTTPEPARVVFRRSAG